VPEASSNTHRARGCNAARPTVPAHLRCWCWCAGTLAPPAGPAQGDFSRGLGCFMTSLRGPVGGLVSQALFAGDPQPTRPVASLWEAHLAVWRPFAGREKRPDPPTPVLTPSLPRRIPRCCGPRRRPAGVCPRRGRGASPPTPRAGAGAGALGRPAPRCPCPARRPWRRLRPHGRGVAPRRRGGRVPKGLALPAPPPCP